MSNQKETKGIIEVVFDGAGGSEVSVKGVKGRSCKDLTAALENALGATVVSDVDTPEMYQQAEVRNEYSRGY